MIQHQSLISLIVLGSAFVFAGCLKPPKLEPQLGTEVTAEAVQKTLGSIKVASPASIEKGEFAYIERSLRIESNAPEVIKQTADTVVDKVDQGDYYSLNIVRQLVEFIDGKPLSSKTELVAQLKKTTDSVAQRPQSFKVNGKLEAQNAQTVKFYNLTSENVLLKVPLLVQMRKNCGGLGSGKCSQALNATRVGFDVVVSENDQVNRSSYIYLISPDVPYFATIMTVCVQTLYPIKDQRVNVLQCDEVKDFSFGSAQ
jgi:hypothetical protein